MIAGDQARGAELPGIDLVAERLAALRDRIRVAGASPAAVTILAVTKGFPADVVAVAAGAGLRELGENYAQELLAKAAWAADRSDLADLRWDFIGQLQRRKVRQLAGRVHRWQSIDRPELVDELAARAPGARLLVQVNTTAEPQKAGCAPDATGALVARARDAGLVVEGLMTVGPTRPGADPTPSFRMLRALVDRFGLDVCSMGMTDDLDVAVREGSTMIRVGRGLFGPRPAPGQMGN